MGPNFRDHFLKHKSLLRPITGKTYRYLAENGPEFLQDLTDLVNDGTLVYLGQGTLVSDQPPGLVFRGEGVTLFTKTNGEFWTLLKSGQGLDLNIRIISTEGAGSPPDVGGSRGSGDAASEGEGLPEGPPPVP
jgi:hypothetical protein